MKMDLSFISDHTSRSVALISQDLCLYQQSGARWEFGSDGLNQAGKVRFTRTQAGWQQPDYSVSYDHDGD